MGGVRSGALQTPPEGLLEKGAGWEESLMAGPAPLKSQEGPTGWKLDPAGVCFDVRKFEVLPAHFDRSIFFSVIYTGKFLFRQSPGILKLHQLFLEKS